MTKNELKKLITDEIDRNAALARRYKKMLDNGEGDVTENTTLNDYYKGMVFAYVNVLSFIDLKDSSPVAILKAELLNVRRSALLCSNE